MSWIFESRAAELPALILLSCLTVACSSPKEPTETSAPIPPTPTAWPASPIPSPTPTLVATPTWEGQPPTPTIFPVVTPAAGPESYQLEQWSEQAALELVAIAEAYGQDLGSALEDYVWFRYPWFYGGELIELAAREVLLRFPSTSSRERLEWLIVLEQATSWRHEAPDAQILTLLETGLNDGRYDLDNLNAVLNSFGFEVWKSFSAPNLFGDGQVVPIIVVAAAQDRDGIIIALRQNSEGRYNLVRVGSYWGVGYSGYRDVLLAELTGDDVPELIAVPFMHSGTMCGESLWILQWQEDHFADLTGAGGIALSFAYYCGAAWRIVPPGDDGELPTIQTIDRIIGYESSTTMTRTFRWNGVVYEMSDCVAVPPPEQLKDDFVIEAAQECRDPLTAFARDEADVVPTKQPPFQAESLLLTESDPAQAIPLLMGILAEPEKEHEDFFPRLYYLLGLAFELMGDDQSAVNAYWQLWRDYPASPYVLMVHAKIKPID
jgi:hypothetical protein